MLRKPKNNDGAGQRVRQLARQENTIPEPLRNVPNEPPTLRAKVFIPRRFRHVIARGGTSTTYSIDPSTIDADFLVATTFQLNAVTAWCMADATTQVVEVKLEDIDSGRIFSDVAQIGRPSAKAGYRLGSHARIAFRTPGGTSSPICTVSHTAGALVVLDISVNVLQS